MDVAERTELKVSWEQVETYCAEMARRLVGRNLDIDVAIPILRGGLIPAALILRGLPFEMSMSLAHIKAYDGRVFDRYRVVRAPDVPRRELVLIIDDIADTGGTVRVVQDMFEDSHSVALFAKPRGSDVVDNFIMAVPQDTWVVFPWESKHE